MEEKYTTAEEIYLMFYSSFEDKFELPDTLLLQWLIKAIAKFSTELDVLNFDKDTLLFDRELTDSEKSLLGEIIKMYYMEREVSKVDKIVSMVGSSFSIDGQGTTKKFTHEELKMVKENVSLMIADLIPSAYS